MKCRIVYSKDNNNLWSWEIVAQNGKVMARGPEAYAARWVARRAVLKLLSPDNQYVEEGDGSGNDYPFSVGRKKGMKNVT
jgi:uncharacterized protein YegP (UPF0339 family)